MSSLMNLRKFVAPEIIFGPGARKLVGKYAYQYSASKVFIVTDKGVINSGWLKDVTDSLEEEGINYHVFSNVTPNPRSTEVMEGAEVYKNEGCDVIISVGGGSPMDCAKGISIVSTHNRNILEFEGVDKIEYAVPPLIFIPTTAGSSADVSQFAIISNQDEFVKIAIISKAMVPDVALIDPDTISTMDSYLTACTGMDALVHAIEAYVSSGSGALTDMYAIESIKLVWNNLRKLISNPNDEKLREKIMLSSMKAGLAFSNASLGAVHAMAHSLGGFLDLPHGECNAMLLDHVINFNFENAIDKFKIISEIMGVDTNKMSNSEIKNNLFAVVSSYKKNLGIQRQLADRGVKSSDISELAGKAIKDACMLTNPRKANKDDVSVIFQEAM